jgi:citronellyl-CoA dehydrogenase
MSERTVTMQDSEIFTADHQAFRKTVKKFAESLAPHAEEWDEAGIFPREVFKQAADLGLFGIRMDPAYGGLGLDWWYTVAYAEELSHSYNAGVNMALMVQSDMATPIINEIGSDEVKKEFLEPAIKGDKIAALGISEPSGGSDVAAIKTTARRDGDDYIINGQKLWITNGTRADFITMAVRTGGPGFGGITLLVFPTDTKGFHIGKKLKKIGNKSSDTAELFFEDCRVPARYRLGDENAGFFHIMTNFQGERLIGALAAVAGMEKAVRDAIRYGTERSAFADQAPGVAAQARRAPDLDRGRPQALLLCGRQGRQGPLRLDPGDHHGEALRRRPDAEGPLRLPAAARRLRLRHRVPNQPGVDRWPPADDRRRDLGDHEGNPHQAREPLTPFGAAAVDPGPRNASRRIGPVFVGALEPGVP